MLKRITYPIMRREAAICHSYRDERGSVAYRRNTRDGSCPIHIATALCACKVQTTITLLTCVHTHARTHTHIHTHKHMHTHIVLYCITLFYRNTPVKKPALIYLLFTFISIWTQRVTTLVLPTMRSGGRGACSVFPGACFALPVCVQSVLRRLPVALCAPHLVAHFADGAVAAARHPADELVAVTSYTSCPTQHMRFNKALKTPHVLNTSRGTQNVTCSTLNRVLNMPCALNT